MSYLMVTLTASQVNTLKYNITLAEQQTREKLKIHTIGEDPYDTDRRSALIEGKDETINHLKDNLAYEGIISLIIPR